jgi:hypothetical protein
VPRRRLRPASAIPAVPQSAAQRFARKLGAAIVTGCVPWTGHRDRDGYGQFWMGGRAHWAHRVAYAIHHGSIPEGLTVDHVCLNPSCCNPAHLRLLTHGENGADANRRTGGRRGSRDAGTLPDISHLPT